MQRPSECNLLQNGKSYNITPPSHMFAAVSAHVLACCAAVGIDLQVDRLQLLRLVLKAPALLKANSSRVASHVQLLSGLGGLTPPDVCKVYTSWPVMASTSLELVKAR